MNKTLKISAYLTGIAVALGSVYAVIIGEVFGVVGIIFAALFLYTVYKQ